MEIIPAFDHFTLSPTAKIDPKAALAILRIGKETSPMSLQYLNARLRYAIAVGDRKTAEKMLKNLEEIQNGRSSRE